MAHHIFGAGVGIDALQCSIDLGGRVAQLLQRCMGQGCIVAGLYRSCRNRAGGEVQFHGASADLILQFQDDPLGNLLANTLGGSEHLFIAGHDSQGKILRTAGGQNGHGRLGAHAIDGGQQFIAALLILAGKAIKFVSILPDGFGDIKPGLLIQFQLAGGIGSDTAAVTHPAAVNDSKARL